MHTYRSKSPFPAFNISSIFIWTNPPLVIGLYLLTHAEPRCVSMTSSLSGSKKKAKEYLSLLRPHRWEPPPCEPWPSTAVRPPRDESAGVHDGRRATAVMASIQPVFVPATPHRYSLHGFHLQPSPALSASEEQRDHPKIGVLADPSASPSSALVGESPPPWEVKHPHWRSQRPNARQEPHVLLGSFMASAHAMNLLDASSNLSHSDSATSPSPRECP